MLKSISTSFLATLACCFNLLLHSYAFAGAPSNETDRLALLAIKSQLHDPLGVTSSWNNSINLCQWTGVTCGHRHQRVTKLYLRNQSIGGILSPHVGNLSFLRLIDLADNNFYGNIPHEVGRLSRLDTLMLANNSFSGKIPTNLSGCSNLINFLAHGNNLVGQIAANIGYNWMRLEKLSISDNRLTGQLPASIGNLSVLKGINVEENRLSGRIPSTLSQLRNLFYLNIAGNQFSGNVPPSIYNLSSLELLYLRGNRLIGSLPIDIGLTLPKLTNFVIAENNFSGPIPNSFSNTSNLVMLDLNLNLFSGKVPINFSRLQNLSWLLLAGNNLGNGAANDLDFITPLTNCSKLIALGLYGNRFGGVLPHSIANLSTTTVQINMGRNQISGTIHVDARFRFSSFHDQDLCSINFSTTRRSPSNTSSPDVPAQTDKSEYAGCSPGANPPTLKSDMKVQGTLATGLMAFSWFFSNLKNANPFTFVGYLFIGFL